MHILYNSPNKDAPMTSQLIETYRSLHFLELEIEINHHQSVISKNVYKLYVFSSTVQI